ncbi:MULTISPECIES: 6-hydroxymethylpterin diphosphokinase MptE-like protein [unclassified Clostridium]|uniref:motility associated factor glycosyltransferase family protein n=1 Tax=unclassified Clostridium TaxID=2614128 RepID=UPI0013F6D91B|nr:MULTISPECIES: 6-hydroxymethylpterin diphosphokinase MptE-like protein [unclassified Clostridium]NFR87434.1 motility associated factor glycosyltransferase family protein [Clostridium botulinum]NFR89398.1 motility associated factor glycosyltransferase family protein [Clostridium botulinum]NFT98963.1 motility associated factor glycosyltransferase family protein [Clostridium botulinum]
MKLPREYFLQQSSDGCKIITIKDNENEICLGNKIDEKANIKKFIKSLNIYDGESIIFIFGLSSGEYIKELMKNIGYGNKVYIFEPEESIYNHTMRELETQNILTDSRIKIFYVKNKNEILDLLNKNLDKSYLNKYTITSYTNYEKAFSKQLNFFSEAVEEFWEVVSTLRASNIMFSNVVVDNYITTMKEIENNINGKKFQNTFEKCTVVVISSGPSLGKNIQYLKKYKDKCIIICAARSVFELLKNDINPDFICAIDPGNISLRLFKQSIKLEFPMVVIEQVNKDIVKNYNGKKIYILNSLKNTMESIYGEEFVSIPVGGSVAHLATGFAVLLGAKNIIFIGQDLAFTDNKYHSELSSNKNLIEEETILEKNNIFYVEGNVEEKVLTNNSFLIFKTWFEIFIENNKNVNFINSTEGGAKIRGTKIMPLKEALSIYCKNKLNKDINLNISQNTTKNISQYFVKKLNLMNKLSLKGIEFSKKMISYYNGNKKIDINYVLNKLDEIDLNFYNNEEIIHILNLFKYLEMEKLSLQSEYREQIKESDSRAGIRLGNRSLECYKIYSNAITEIIEKLNA